MAGLLSSSLRAPLLLLWLLMILYRVPGFVKSQFSTDRLPLPRSAARNHFRADAEGSPEFMEIFRSMLKYQKDMT
jgi:hypothetical protein